MFAFSTTRSSFSTGVSRAGRGPAVASGFAGGNQALQHLIVAGLLRPKLEVAPANNAAEQEADRLADEALRTPAPGCTCGGTCPKCNSNRVSGLARHAAAEHTAGATVSENVVSDIGDGKPLDSSARAYFEPRFGQDFGHVRLHADSRAAASARAVNALAFTLGRDLVFGAGQYAPHTAAGRRLLAHELAHVVQQRGAGRSLQRKTATKTPCSVHAYDASDPKDTAVIPDDDSGIGVTSVADMVTKINAHVNDDKNACSCVARLEINGHGTDGYQSVGNGSKYVNDDKAIVYNSTDEHLKQLTKIKFCDRGLFMLLGCHVGQGNGKTLLSKLAALLPGKLIGGAQHYTAGTGLGNKKVTGEGDKPSQPMSKRDPFLSSRFVRWHIVINGKEYVIPGDETTTAEGEAKLKAADKIKVKTPEGVEIIKK